jgi:hypothetical protein
MAQMLQLFMHAALRTEDSTRKTSVVAQATQASRLQTS